MDGQLTKCDTQVWTNAPFAQPGSAILDLLFSPAGDKLAVRRRSEIAVLQWNENRIATVLHSATVSRHGQSMAFSSNGELLAYPAPGGKVAISGCGTDSVSRVLSGVMDTINSIAISPDDRMLAAADWSPRIAVLDLASGAELSSLTNHAAWISSVAFLPDGKGLVSASADQTIRHWNTTGWQEVAIRRGHLDEVNCLATSPRGDWMASGGKDGALNLWTTKPALRQATRLEFEGSRGLLSLDARTLLLVGSDGMLTRWDALALRPQASNNSREMLGTHTALGLGVQRLAVGRPGGKVEIWSIANWSRVLELKPSSEEVFSLRFSLDESLLAAVNSSQQLSIWDCSDGRQVAGIGPFKINISAVEFSPSKKRVSIGFTDGSIQVWNLTPSFLFRNLRGQSQGAWAEHMQFSPDGCSLATGNPDATLRIWNLDNGSFASLPRALMAYFSVAYSPDGGRLAAAGPDPVVRIIDTATGEEVAALDRNTKYRDFADLVRFSADGNALLILTGNSLTVWHAASLSEIEGSDRVPANPNLR
jgi:WD40 repeat protein